MSVDLTTGTPSYGSWGKFVDEVCRPVMLKNDGTVDYELDHNDQTLRLDGTASDITNTSYGGNAMVEFRKYKWVKRYEDDDYEYVIFSDSQWDSDYHAYAHTSINGNIRDAFYWGMFKGSMPDTSMRSIGSGTLLTEEVPEDFVFFAEANGEGYNTIYKSGWDYIADLLTLISKSDDSQTAFGRGYVKSTNSSSLSIGTMKNKPAFCGYSNGTTDVKVLYIEGAWGNTWDLLAGLKVDTTNGFSIKMVPPYNIEGDGYAATGIFPNNSSSTAYYVDTTSCTDSYGYIPKTTNGSSSTYMCDRCSCASAGSYPVVIGGGWSNESECGSRCMYSDSLVESGQTWISARLSYIQP